MNDPSWVKIDIPGRIGGKGRPRFSRATGHTYTPAKTVSDEGIVRSFASAAMAGRPLVVGAVNLELGIYRSYPKSWSAKRREAAIYITGKPDLDNVMKLVADALNGIVYGDDSQIATAHVWKRYTTNPEHVFIHILPLEPQ